MDNKDQISKVIFEPVIIDEEAVDFQRQLAQDIVNADVALENRKRAVLLDVKTRLSRLEPVRITEEILELGLESEVQTMINSAEYSYKINRFFLDDDDLGSTDPYWFLG